MTSASDGLVEAGKGVSGNTVCFQVKEGMAAYAPGGQFP